MKQLLILGCIALSTVSLYGMQTGQSSDSGYNHGETITADASFKTAQQYFNQGKLDDAMFILGSLITNPEWLEQSYGLEAEYKKLQMQALYGSIFFLKSKKTPNNAGKKILEDKAITFLIEAAASGKFPAAAYNLALVYINQGDREDNIDLLNQALTILKRLPTNDFSDVLKLIPAVENTLQAIEEEKQKSD